MATESCRPTSESSRRDFVKGSIGSAALLSAGALAVHAAGSDRLKVGLIGCGGRGSGAALDALQADPHVVLTAMGDTFSDRLESSHLQLSKTLPAKVAVPPDQRFVGFDAYKKVIDSGVDVVVLASPPHFRPAHLEYAIDKGKHVFAEKPVAVDAPGVRKVLETCKKAKEKNLAVVSGLCWRYHPGMRETVQRVQDGAIGKVVALQCNYNTGALWHRDRKPGMSDMEWQVRNWLYFTWLSGDHNVEQHIHSIDKMAWILGDEYPIRAVGLGGRQARTQSEFGHIFDHHAVCYEFKNGVRCFSFCRQQQGTANDVEDYVYGSEGTARLIAHRIDGAKPFRWRAKPGQKANMYQQEHDELFASIRSGKPINNGDYMAKSTLMAIMGRMATYTGQSITWDMAMNSTEDLTPASYEWTNLSVAPVAIPGVTKFV